MTYSAITITPCIINVWYFLHNEKCTNIAEQIICQSATKYKTADLQLVSYILLCLVILTNLNNNSLCLTVQVLLLVL